MRDRYLRRTSALRNEIPLSVDDVAAKLKLTPRILLDSGPLRRSPAVLRR